MKDANFINSRAYMRQSAALIKKALQKGCDVMDYGNGEIVTTETITVIVAYQWNPASGKLVKIQNKPTRPVQIVEIPDIAGKKAKIVKRLTVKRAA